MRIKNFLPLLLLVFVLTVPAYADGIIEGPPAPAPTPNTDGIIEGPPAASPSTDDPDLIATILAAISAVLP